MKNWHANLTSSYKTTIVSFIAVILAYFSLFFAYFIEHSDIPNGLILGGGIGVLSYLLIGLVEKSDAKRKKPVLTIIVTVLRYLAIAAAIVLSALAFFKWNKPIFNPFSVLGGYLIPLIVYLVILLVDKKYVR